MISLNKLARRLEEAQTKLVDMENSIAILHELTLKLDDRLKALEQRRKNGNRQRQATRSD